MLEQKEFPISHISKLFKSSKSEILSCCFCKCCCKLMTRKYKDLVEDMTFMPVSHRWMIYPP